MCEISTVLYEYPKKHGLSVEWIADNVGVNAGTLHRYLNPHDTLPFPLKLLIPFCKTCNDFSAIDLVESRIGRKAYVQAGAIDLNMQAVGALAKEAGEAISCLADSLSDARISEDERKACNKELFELQDLIGRLLKELNK